MTECEQSEDEERAHVVDDSDLLEVALLHVELLCLLVPHLTHDLDRVDLPASSNSRRRRRILLRRSRSCLAVRRRRDGGAGGGVGGGLGEDVLQELRAKALGAIRGEDVKGEDVELEGGGRGGV